MSRRMLPFLSLCILTVLIVGSVVVPNSLLFLFASLSQTYLIIRLLIAAALITLMVLEPPRNILVRYIIGSIAFIGLGGTLTMTYYEAIGLFDSLVFSAASIATGIVVLEDLPVAPSVPKTVAKKRRPQRSPAHAMRKQQPAGA